MGIYSKRLQNSKNKTKKQNPLPVIADLIATVTARGSNRVVHDRNEPIGNFRSVEFWFIDLRKKKKHFEVFVGLLCSSFFIFFSNEHYLAHFTFVV